MSKKKERNSSTPSEEPYKIAAGYKLRFERIRSIFTESVGIKNTQRAISEAIGVHENQWKRWENEREPPGLSALIRIVMKTGCSMRYLVMDEGEPFPSVEPPKSGIPVTSATCDDNIRHAIEESTEEDKNLEFKSNLAVGRKPLNTNILILDQGQGIAMKLSDKYRQIPYAGTHAIHFNIKTILVDVDAKIYDGDLCVVEVDGRGRSLKYYRQDGDTIILEEPGMVGASRPEYVHGGAVYAARVVGFMIK